jgi:hypothetical protein
VGGQVTESHRRIDAGGVSETKQVDGGLTIVDMGTPDGLDDAADGRYLASSEAIREDTPPVDKLLNPRRELWKAGGLNGLE